MGDNENGSSPNLSLGLQRLPQDPFYPREQGGYGPSYLDTQACLCSLQSQRSNADESSENDEGQDKQSNDRELAWQCIGNQTQGVYAVTSGKWFNNIAGGSGAELPIYDSSNRPNTDKAFMWDSGKDSLVDIDLQTLTPYDQACTGENHTTFSTAFYRAVAQTEAGETPVDGAPCYREGGIPIQIQNLTNWQNNGCPDGFLCANNTVNSLPQYCPPLVVCQTSRLSGGICQFNERYIGMGPFEPVVCQGGYYCPKEANGKDTFPCPAGTYCQPGAPTPTPCTAGSYCPEKSTSEIFMIPLAVLLIFDALAAFAILWYTLRKRFGNRNRSRHQSKSKGVTAFAVGRSGYRELQDDQDNEMAPMEATYIPRADTWIGFQGALDISRPSLGNIEEHESGFSPQLRAFVESMRKATDATHFGLSFGYSDLSFHPKGVPKPILQNVTGSIERGSLTAVMGGSGAGKSTFVNVLMGKTANTGGSVMVNNMPGKIKGYKKLIGYVPQDDIVLPELTVYENILHSARIRLPSTWSDHVREAHVSSVIDCLELSHVRDSLVGSVGKPVISGGQRKRVSIGMELAAAPMAIFLDEPTSGLDATAASSIMLTLKAIARLGISIIVIIHQPRMEIFEMLDDLILLANGQIIYEGPESGVQRFFENVGFVFPEHSNFGDVVTDIITGNGRSYKRSGDISKDGLIANWQTSRENADLKSRHESLRSQPSSIHSSSMKRELLRKRGAPRLKQIQLCLERALLQQWRAKSTFWFEMGLATLAAVLLGLAENSKKGVMFTGIYNEPFDILSVATDLKSVPELALLTAIAIGLVSGAPGVKVFSEETLLYRREAEAGHSRIAYFLAKNVSVLPRMVLGCLHFSTVLLVLATPIIPWGNAFIANLLYFYCIYGLASIVSMVSRREDAPLFATMISLIVGILSGASPPLSKVIEWHVEWLWRASPGTWLAEIYFGQIILPSKYLYQVELASTLTGYHLDWFGRNLGALFVIGTIYRVLAYLGLVTAHRLRR